MLKPFTFYIFWLRAHRLQIFMEDMSITYLTFSIFIIIVIIGLTEILIIHILIVLPNEGQII